MAGIRSGDVKVGVTGAAQLRKLSADLKRGGNPAKGIRSKMRRNITAAVQPMKKDAQRNARAIPVTHTTPTDVSLRNSIAKATQIRISTTRQVYVRLWVNPARMPAGQGALPRLMEGERRWRHPVFGHDVWVTQPSHPYFKPAVDAHLPGVVAGVVSAVNEAAIELERGTRL